MKAIQNSLLRAMISALTMLVLAYTLFQPMFFTQQKQDVTLSLSLCTERNPSSFGNEIRIREILVDGAAIDLEAIAEKTQGWDIREKLLFAAGTEHTDPIELQFDQIKQIIVRFFGQEGSGIVKIRAGRMEKRLDLYWNDGWKSIECRYGNTQRFSPGKRMWMLLAGVGLIYLALGCTFFHADSIRKRIGRAYGILFPIWSTAMLMMLAVAVGCVWETDDDRTISFLLYRANNEFCPFIGQVLANTLIRVYWAFPGTNWWLVTQLIGIALGTMSILYVLCRHEKPIVSLPMAVIICGIVWTTALDVINFTRSAVVLAMGGCALIADAVLLRREAVKEIWPEYMIGCIFLFLGQQIRSDCAWIALAGLAAVGLSVMLIEGFTLTIKSIGSWILRGALLLTAAGVVLCAGIADNRLLEPEEKAYTNYNALRSSIEDYSNNYVNYKENGSNLSAENLDTFLKWYSEDTEVFNEEVLRKTIESGIPMGVSGIFDMLLNTLSFNPLCAVASVLCILLFTIRTEKSDKKHCFAKVIPGIVGLLLVLYLIYKGRLPDRVYSSICFVASIAYLLLCSREDDRSEIFLREVSWKRKACFGGIGCALLLLAANVYPKTEDIRWKGLLEAEKDCASNELLDYITSRDTDTFFFPILEEPVSVTEGCTIWSVIPPDYCNNLFYLGGWTARMPYKIQLLFERGITNPSRALLENDRVYTIETTVTTDFLRNNYCKNIAITGVTEIAGTMLVQYTCQIPDDQMTGLQIKPVELNILEEMHDKKEGWRVSGRIKEASSIVIYCNLNINDIRYTYRIHTDEEGEFSVFLYGIPKGTDRRQAGLAFYKKEA